MNEQEREKTISELEIEITRLVHLIRLAGNKDPSLVRQVELRSRDYEQLAGKPYQNWNRWQDE